MLAALKGYNVVGIFHGHQHETAMIYRREGIDLFKPKAAFMGGFAVVRVTNGFMDVAFAEARGCKGRTRIYRGFQQETGQWRAVTPRRSPIVDWTTHDVRLGFELCENTIGSET